MGLGRARITNLLGVQSRASWLCFKGLRFTSASRAGRWKPSIPPYCRYTKVQVWVPAGLRGAHFGRPKPRELALFRGIASRLAEPCKTTETHHFSLSSVHQGARLAPAGLSRVRPGCTKSRELALFQGIALRPGDGNPHCQFLRRSGSAVRSIHVSQRLPRFFHCGTHGDPQ